MKTPTHDAALAALSEVLALSPGEYRIGQLMALMGDFGQDEYGFPLAELEDDQLLALLTERVREYRARLADPSPVNPASPLADSKPLLTETP